MYAIVRPRYGRALFCSVYFGDERVTPVTCVLAIQELSKRFEWFSSCVRDIRMLRIEENNDLSPAIEPS